MTILRAIKKGNLEEVNNFIRNGGDVNMIVDSEDDRTPLMIASEKGQKEMADLLIKNGADVNSSDSRGESPLSFAFASGDLTLAKLLIDNGAKVETFNKAGSFLLSYATIDENIELANFFLDNLDDINIKNEFNGNLLMEVMNPMNSEEFVYRIAKLLVERGIDTNARNSPGGTALAGAVYCGFYSVVEFLIEKGADVNTRGEFRYEEGHLLGNLALLYAMHFEFKEIEKLLRSHGAR